MLSGDVLSFLPNIIYVLYILLFSKDLCGACYMPNIGLSIFHIHPLLFATEPRDEAVTPDPLFMLSLLGTCMLYRDLQVQRGPQWGQEEKLLWESPMLPCAVTEPCILYLLLDQEIGSTEGNINCPLFYLALLSSPNLSTSGF
jgi:hypothetical protein